MQGKTRLLIAGLLFLGLLVWAVTNERGRVPQEGEAFGIDAKTVSKLEVRSTDRSLTLEKQGEQWSLTQPFKGYADKDVTERMVKAIAELRPTGERKDANLNDPKFGLDKPQLTAVMTYEGRKTVTLYIGSEAPGGSEFFARIEGRNRLYFVPASLRTDLLQQPDALRDKTVVHVESDKLVSATLQYPDRVISFEKRAGDTPDKSKWFLTQPYAAKADEWNCKQIFDKLANLRVEAFAPDPVPAGTDTGLAKPVLKVTVKAEDGKQYVVTFGAKTRLKVSESQPVVVTDNKTIGTEKDLVYVQVEGRPETLLCADTALNDLTKSDMDLRDKRILDVQRDSIQELRVERTQGLSFSARRLPDGWQLTAPNTGRAKTSKIDDLLWDVAELEAQEFLGEQKDLKQYGLEVPETVVTLRTQSGEPVKLYIGYAKGESGHYCRTSQSKEVYVVGDTLMLDLPKAAADLKDTTPTAPTAPPVTPPPAAPSAPAPSGS